MNKKVEDGTKYMPNYEKENHKWLEYMVSKNEIIIEKQTK
jgi:hypothetical protein